MKFKAAIAYSMIFATAAMALGNGWTDKSSKWVGTWNGHPYAVSTWSMTWADASKAAAKSRVWWNHQMWQGQLADPSSAAEASAILKFSEGNSLWTGWPTTQSIWTGKSWNGDWHNWQDHGKWETGNWNSVNWKSWQDWFPATSKQGWSWLNGTTKRRALIEYTPVEEPRH